MCGTSRVQTRTCADSHPGEEDQAGQEVREPVAMSSCEQWSAGTPQLDPPHQITNWSYLTPAYLVFSLKYTDSILKIKSFT